MVDVKEYGEERLYILKGPGVISWTILLSFIFLGISIAVYFTDSIITQSLCLLLCLTIGLTCMEEWEDCIFDRYENKIILTRSKWYTRLLGRKRNTRRLQLSNIRAIEVTNQGILMVLKSGISIPVTETPLNQRDMKIVSVNIASFLRLNHVEELSADPCIGYEDWFDLDHSDTSQEYEVIAEEILHLPRPREQIKILSEPAPLS